MFYSVCLPAVFRGIPTAEAVDLAYACGAPSFEIWGWQDQELDAIAAAQKKTGLTCTAVCARSFALTDPSRREEYITGLYSTLEACEKLNCRQIITQVGPDTGMPREYQHRSIVEGLRACAPILEQRNVTLMIEPLNTAVDHKGYYLTSSREALDIVHEAASPCVKMLFDIYHQQINEGDLITNLLYCKDEIAHIHVAANPGRGEPDIDDEINYPAIFKALSAAGWKGPVGLEYMPKQDACAGLRRILREMKLN